MRALRGKAEGRFGAMIGLDTNVLVRYLTRDDPGQSGAANQLIEAQCSYEEPCRLSMVVLCELIRVPRSAYGHDRATIATVLERLLTATELEAENEEVAWLAWRAYRDGAADFADYCTLFTNRQAGCSATFTFDRELAQHPLALAIEPGAEQDRATSLGAVQLAV